MARYNDITIKPNTSPANTTQQNTRIYRGISTIDSNISNTSRYDIALIRQDVINSLNIRQGEKINNPTFGSIIWDHLYEPLTEALKDRITANTRAVVEADPRVRLEEFAVDSKDYGLMIIVSLRYIKYNVSETLRLNFDQQNNLL
jgi:phage baseplate assembly protein W